MTDDKSDDIKPGILLVASAHLADLNFTHSVIFLCEHRPQGSFGLVLNQLTDLTLDKLIESVDCEFPVYHGGPVEENSIHFLHRRPDLDLGSKEVLPGVFWGGDYERLHELLRKGEIKEGEFRFFLGYSGWGAGQLREEMLIDSWYTVPATEELVFDECPESHWRSVLKAMGPEYKIMSIFPDDPRFN